MITIRKYDYLHSNKSMLFASWTRMETCTRCYDAKLFAFFACRVNTAYRHLIKTLQVILKMKAEHN